MPTLRKIALIAFALSLLLFKFVKTASAQPATNLKKIDQFLQQKLQTSNIPGFAIAIVDRDRIVFSKGYGHDGNNKPVTDETPFAIASLSKAFTAMAVMQLAEAGKVNLDSGIRQYIPSIGHKADRITVRQLLNQTSGFSDIVYPELSFYKQPENLEAVIENLSKVELASKPGEKFHYHNPNYQVLAKLVEAASGDDFSHYLRNNIFTPLQMKHTAAASNTKNFYSLPAADLPLGYASIFGYRHKMRELNWFVKGSAGMISTADDMAHAIIMYLNKGNFKGTHVLSPKEIETMQTPPGRTTNGYGMGWFITDKNNFSHTGILWTSQSEQLIMTKQGYGIVILFNSGLNAFQDYSSFTRGIADILNHKDPEVSSIPTIAYEIFTLLLVIVALLSGVRRLGRMKNRQDKFRRRSNFQTRFRMALRLLPLIIFLFIPQLITLISGRVLNWERVFWMMPGVVIWLGIVAIFNIIIVTFRISSTLRINRNLSRTNQQ